MGHLQILDKILRQLEEWLEIMQAKMGDTELLKKNGTWVRK